MKVMSIFRKYIKGSGEQINSQGWKRLSVVIGTGNTSQSKRIIAPKINGIGSKNFGLRTLFLFGDVIYISSSGKQTVLDMRKGALPKPIVETSSKRKKGVQIKVPYRTLKRGRLEAFSFEREEEALSKLGSELTHVLIKLAHPDAKKSLKQVLVTSKRCNRQFKWKQSVERIPSKIPGIIALQRKIRMFDSWDLESQIIEELEFQKTFTLPKEFKNQNIPTYFKVKNGGIRLALAVRIHKGKIDIKQPGLFYYPIGVNSGYTGTAVSINAPFQMDIDRSQLEDPQNNKFNAWLLETAANLTINLLTGDWYERFGFIAYHTLNRITQPALSFYIDQLDSKIKKAECWATRAKKKNSTNPTVYKRAEDIVIPAKSHLDGFLSDFRYLDKNICDDEILSNLAKANGAKTFTINSLVRLRCAGENSAQMKTKIKDDEANYYFTDYNYLKNISTQEKFAKALDAEEHLTIANLEDLRHTPSTLLANGELNSPSSAIWLVNPNIASVCPIPESQRLHPSLIQFKIFNRLCTPFKITTWINDLIERIRINKFTEEERLALYKYILSVNGRVSRSLISDLRFTSVLMDHRGRWVEPSLITLRKVKRANQLKDVLHFPHLDYEKDENLANLFHFKNKITGEDLIKYARLIKFHPEQAPKFEEILCKHDEVLNKNVINQLKEIDFLRSINGTISKPVDLYIQNPINRICLGQSAHFIAGAKINLYKKLGCRERPKATDIIEHLGELRSKGVKPLDKETLYNELIMALRAEHLPLNYFQNESILLIENTYSSPSDTLLGSQYKRTFLDSIPIASNLPNSLYAVYYELGAHKKPQQHHWYQFFLWINQKYQLLGDRLTELEKSALRNAYIQIQNLPAQLLNNIKCFLDRNGKLHDLIAIQNNYFIIDDNSQLSDEIERLNLPLFFADVKRGETIQFYENIVGVKRLTNVSELINHQIVGEKAPPHWLREDKILEKLQNDNFISAVKVLTEYSVFDIRQKALTLTQFRTKLKSIKKILFVEALNGSYRIKHYIVNVPIPIILLENKIILTEVQSLNELYGLLSQVIAGLFAADVAEIRSLADAIFRLVTSDTTIEIQNYFFQRGISWEPCDINGSDDAAQVTDEFCPSNPEENEQIEDILKDIARGMVQKTGSASAEQRGQDRIPSKKPKVSKAPSKAELKLPPIEQVSPQFLESSGVKKGNLTGKASGKKKSHSGTWQPPTPHELERDQSIGRRGEELVYREELKRVKKLGYPESRVVKTFEIDPGGDHDIQSVNEMGEDIWIEVKSTTGKSGRFNWSRAEFEKALKERKNYVLWRVYEAHTKTPSFKTYKDPINLLVKQEMRLDIASMYAEVESL
ncbi:MAG TPA: DUF3883 domain-containing protein [Pyrinomonadaceae bacterium]